MNFYSYLTEARLEDLVYTEKKVKGAIDKVIVQLESKPSEKYTKLARAYGRLKKANEKLKEKQDQLNEKLKGEVLSLFDATDEIYTRVVETCSLTMNVSKKLVTTKTDVDYDAVIKGITELVPELESQINELIAANTSVKTSERSPALRVDLKESEDLLEGFDLKTLKSWARGILMKVKFWGRTFDKKLANLKKLAKL